MWGERVIGLCLMALAGLYLHEASGIGDVTLSYIYVGPRVFPSLLAVALLGMSLVLVVGRRKVEVRWAPRELQVLLLVSGCVVLYGLLMDFLGFALATLVLTCCGMLVALRVDRRGVSWPVKLLVAVLFAGALRLLFTNVFDIPLPKGVLGW